MSRYRPALLAAAVLLAMIPIALYVYAGRERPTHLLVQRSLGKTGLQAGQHLTSSTLRLLAGQEVYLRSGVGRAQMAVRGPAVVHLDIAKVRGRLRLRCRVERGQLLLQSDPGEQKSIEWSDRSGRYVLRGTSAILTVDRSAQSLAVYEGAFDYYPRLPGSTVRVAAGRVLRTSPGTAPVLERLDKRRRAAFELQARRFDLVARGRPFLSRERRLFSRGAIRRHYGALHRVRLKDGRVFYGFSVRGRQELEIHTVFGVLKLQHDQVLRIEPVP